MRSWAVRRHEAPTRPRAVPNRSATHAWRTPRLGADRTLRELSLEYNELGVRGAQEVGNALSLNRSLTRLNLSRNGLGPATASVPDGTRPATDCDDAVEMAPPTDCAAPSGPTY